MNTTVVEPAPRLASSQVSQPRRLSQHRREAIAGYVLIAPFLLGLTALGIGPFFASLWLSFTDYNLLSPPTWVGAENYRDLLSDPRYLKSLAVTFTFVVLAVPLQLVAALAVAVLLNRQIRGVAIYRAVFYVPSLLGGSVAIAVVWRQLFAGDGVVNRILRMVGWHNPPSWLQDPDFALYTLVLLTIWQFGAPMIIFLAALRQVPRDLYEAAETDGAGTWQRFVSITLPMVSPIVLFNLVMGMIGAFQAFTGAYIISGGKGDPLDSTLFYTLYLYIQGFGYLHMGYASAMAWILLLIIGLATGLIFATSRRWVFYAEAQS